MQTTPPMVMASAPKAGAVHPCTRKIAAVAMSVAMVMPETGLAEEPTRPTMRELTVTKRNPKTTTSSEAARFAAQPTKAPGTGLNSRKRNMQSDDKQRADDHHAHGEIVFRAHGLGLRGERRGAWF